MISYFKYGNGSLNYCEDSLTAGIFDLLKYLPTDLFWSILKNALLQDNLPSYCGAIKQIEYWPKWNSKDTSNSKYVEPDLFIRFQDFDLIIEAKRKDENQQYAEQLNNELISYYNEFEEDDKTVYLLQVGGLIDGCEKQELKIKEKVIKQSKTNWSRLLRSVKSVNQSLEKQNLPNQKPLQLLLYDLENIFSAHGFYHIRWLEGLDKMIINSNTTILKFERNAR